MIKTYDIDLDDELVEEASRLFESLGTDIDSAIKIFLKQAVLRKGFPFEIAVPEEAESGKVKVEREVAFEGEISAQSESPAEVSDSDGDIHGGITEDEESAAATVTSVPAEIAARVAANEALVAEMRKEIGDKEVTPEFDENEDDGTHGNYEQQKVEKTAPGGDEPAEDETAPARAEEPAKNEPEAQEDDSEDEDETTPDNLFDAWDVGDEEEIGCK